MASVRDVVVSVLGASHVLQEGTGKEGGTKTRLFVTVSCLRTSDRPSSRRAAMAAAWVGVTEN